MSRHLDRFPTHRIQAMGPLHQRRLLRPPRPRPWTRAPRLTLRAIRSRSSLGSSPATKNSWRNSTAPRTPSPPSCTHGEALGWFRRVLITGQNGHATGRLGIVLFVRPTRPTRRNQRDLRTGHRPDEGRDLPSQATDSNAPLHPGRSPKAGDAGPQKLGTTGPQKLGTAH